MNKQKNPKIKKIFRAELAYGSTQMYLWHLKKYVEFLEEEGLTFETADPLSSIQTYINSNTIESDQPWTKSTVNVAFYALKKYWEKVRFTPIERRFFTNTGVKSEHEPRILDRRETEKVWRGVHEKLDETEQIMVHTGWEAALRTGELVTLKGRNLTPDGGIDVRVLKTKRARKQVSLEPETYSRLLGLGRGEGRYLFLHEVNSKYSKFRHYTSLEWSCFFHRWTSELLNDTGIRWHDFARHTRLTHYAEDTKSFIAVLQLSGHQNPAVCRQYFERAKIDVPELEVIGKGIWEW